jgi:hypothetical protein
MKNSSIVTSYTKKKQFPIVVHNGLLDKIFIISIKEGCSRKSIFNFELYGKKVQLDEWLLFQVWLTMV